MGAPPSGEALVVLQKAEAALNALGEARNPETLVILRDLEAANVDGATLRHSKIYDMIGEFAKDQDAVGIAAKALRRRWRILMDDASSRSASRECMFLGEKQQAAKRPRLG